MFTVGSFIKGTEFELSLYERVVEWTGLFNIVFWFFGGFLCATLIWQFLIRVYKELVCAKSLLKLILF